jgi:hypothetical protein
MLCCVDYGRVHLTLPRPVVAVALAAAAPLVVMATACSRSTGTHSLSADAWMVGVETSVASRISTSRPIPNSRRIVRVITTIRVRRPRAGSSITMSDIHGIAEVTESVGVYPHPGIAGAAFDNLVSSLRKCSALHARDYEFTLDNKYPSTVALNLANSRSSIASGRRR